MIGDTYPRGEQWETGEEATFAGWLRDESVEDSASLPSPDVLAEEIVEDLRAALEQFEEIGTDLKFPQP